MFHAFSLPKAMALLTCPSFEPIHSSFLGEPQLKPSTKAERAISLLFSANRASV